MSRSTTRAHQDGGKGSGRTVQPRSKGTSLIDAWWASVLAGDVSDPHPIHREVRVQLHGVTLRLSGELDSIRDRDELVSQARERTGHGIDRVNVSGLKLAQRQEKPGILNQTLISAFPGGAAAEYARDFVLQHSRVVPKLSEIIDSANAQELRTLLPEDFARDALKKVESGRALLILRVDETEAFKVRELLAEDTRSEWTVAMPPQLAEGRR